MRDDAGDPSGARRSRPDPVSLLYRGLGAYYTLILVILSVLTVAASVAGEFDIALLLLLLGGVPLTLRYLVRRYAARRQ